MKNNIVIFLVVLLSSLTVDINNSIHSLGAQELAPNIHKSKSGSHILSNNVFKTTIGGEVDSVWQHIVYKPEWHDITTNHFFAASDGSFYYASYIYNRGGLLTKINESGSIEWTINRMFSEDTSKYYILFENISELINGNILVYGYEVKVDLLFRFHDIYPIRFIISPDGTVKEEKSMRTLLPKSLPNGPVYTIFPDARVYVNREKPDSISIFSIDTSFTKIQNILTFNNEYKKDMYNRIRGILPYNSASFTIVNSGLFPLDTARSVTLLRYTKEFELINRLVIHTENEADVAINTDGSYFILQGRSDRTFITSKYDTKGNLLWKKQPELLKNLKFFYFEITKGQKEGFYITGEIYSFKDDGSINYSDAHLGIIAKLNDEGECDWYYTTGDKYLTNKIMSFAEASNGDVVFVCNSIVYGKEQETSIQITRLRPRATGVLEQVLIPNDNISVYPTPTTTTVTISGIENGTSLHIMNSIGMEVANQQVINSKAEIDATHLASGMYFAVIHSLKGTIMKPIIVSH